jgi:membrane protein
LSFPVTTAHLTARLGPLRRWLLSRWPGRIALRVVAGCIRLELFDRAMAISAQLFTSVFPILIMLSGWLGESTRTRLAESFAMPPAAQNVLKEALDEPAGAAFGLVGSLIVLVSATSLSRALTRAMTTIWHLPRPRTRLSSAWRWLTVVLGLALTALVARSLGRYAEALPPTHAWSVVLTLGIDMILAVFVPWLLLAGQVSLRRLLPGALCYALSMLAVRPASDVYLPRALELSADRYGPIGVAFAYLTTLYVLAFVFLAAHIVGRAVVEELDARSPAAPADAPLRGATRPRPTSQASEPPRAS